MDVPSSSSSFALHSVKERMREKLKGPLKAVKLQTSLAAKIKTKLLNNSSIQKVSLKRNNKALACALTAERENSRRLESDKLFLQKEVKMLHFQNALLRQNLSIVNKMLKDIDVLMKINLSAAIEISSNMESSDRLSVSESRSDRFSRQSAMTLDEDQGYRLTGVALRVPSNSVVHQKRNSHQTSLVNEQNHHTVPPSPIATVVRENSGKLDEPEMPALNLSPKEYLSINSENATRDSVSNWKVNDSLLPFDDVFSSNRNAQSGGYVTKRKKRSTVSHFSNVSKKSETNQTRSSVSRSSSPGTSWEMNKDITILPDTGDTGLDGVERSYIDSTLQDGRLSTMSFLSSLPKNMGTDQSSDACKDISTVLYEEQTIQSTNPLQLVLNDEHECIADGYLGQERTLYEADMEMTSSKSPSIIAVLPKSKMQAPKPKSGIPVQQSSISRKVKKSVREKNRKTVQQATDSSDSNEKVDPADNYIEDLISDRRDPRTCALLGPVVQESLDILESRTQSNLEMSASRESCASEKICTDNPTVLNGGRSEALFIPEKDHCTEAVIIADMAPKKRKSKITEVSHMESSQKKKRKTHKTSKDQKQLIEENNIKSGSTEQIDSSKENSIPSFRIKNKETKIKRETYFVSTTKLHPVENDPVAKAHEMIHRRETFLIPEPNPLVTVTVKTSVLEERNDAIVHPQNFIVPIVVSRKTENRSDPQKLDPEAELCKPTSYHEVCENKKRISRCPKKNACSGLFSELDKRAHVLPSKKDGFRGEKAMLVRESFANLTSSQSNKASKSTDIKANGNDSFMLDMVSESILDNTMEFSSFAEFPSATNPESTFTIDMSLTRIPAPELPVSEDCNDLSHALTNKTVLDENFTGEQQNSYETEANHQCKEEDNSLEIQETAIKPFLDLTNKSLGSTKQSPKSCSDEESRGYSRRRKPVNYKEPNLSSKLRRGDKLTDSAFLGSPVMKGKVKKGRGRNKVKFEACGIEDI